MELFKEDPDIYNDMELETTDMSRDYLLNQLSLQVMKDNIINQITEDELTITTDYFDIVKNKFYVILNSDIDYDVMSEIKESIHDFCSDIILAIDKEYDLCINYNFEDESLEVIEILDALYHFFILEHNENTITFIKNYIDMYKSNIISTLGLNDKKKLKDITSLANKEKNMSIDDICILSNLDKIINFIIHDDEVSNSDFIKTLYRNDIIILNMKQYIDTDLINNNFVSKYIQFSYDDSTLNLKGKVETLIINKYIEKII